MFLGAAVGDALGWPQEDRSQIIGGTTARNVVAQPVFRPWERQGGSRFARYLDPVEAGAYSDDTQLLLAVARSCFLQDDWYDWFTRIELPQWPIYQRGGGGAVLRAARAWADGRAPWVDSQASKQPRSAGAYFTAGANGVAMRIAPHVLASVKERPDELLLRVARDGLATHGHPRAILGGFIHALALRHALVQQGTLEYGELVRVVQDSDVWRRSFDVFLEAVDSTWHKARERHQPHDEMRLAVLWEQTVNEIDALLRNVEVALAQGALVNDQQTLEDLGCFDKKQRGSGTVSAIAALYVATRTAARPMSGLLRTGFLSNADTDTLCSMTGSLLGAVHGPGWLGDLGSGVQDHRYILSAGERMADLLNKGVPLNQGSLIPLRKSITSGHIRSWTTQLFSPEGVSELPDGRSYTLRKVHPMKTTANNYAMRVLGVTGDGQTIIIDRTSKNPILIDQQNLAESNSGGDGSRLPESSDEKALPNNSSALLNVEVLVSDVSQTAVFFEQLLGIRVVREGNRLLVGGAVAFRERGSDVQPEANAGTAITLAVRDVKAIVDRLERDETVKYSWPGDLTLWLVGPDGVRVRLVELPQRAFNGQSRNTRMSPRSHDDKLSAGKPPGTRALFRVEDIEPEIYD